MTEETISLEVWQEANERLRARHTEEFFEIVKKLEKEVRRTGGISQ